MVAAAGSALAFALSFPLSENFVGGWPLAFVWPLLLALAAWMAPSWRALVVAVFPMYFAAFLAHQWWMREVTELGMPVLVAYLAAWLTVQALLVRALAGSRATAEVIGGRGLPFAVAVPVTLVAVEFLRGDLVCTGYAWFYAAHPLSEWTTLAQVASVGGGWLVSAMAGLVAGAALDAFVGRGRTQAVSPLIAVGIVAGAFVFGSIHRVEVTSMAVALDPEREARILLVQTNLPMSNKLRWEPAAQLDDFVEFARLTIEGARKAEAADAPVDVAVWPETMVPGFGLEPESLRTLVDRRLFPLDRFAEGLRDLSSRVKAPLIVGSPAFLGLRAGETRFAWDHQFNSAYLVGPDGARGRTDKIFLTPFGETMPIISNWDWLEERLLALGADGMSFDLEAAANPHRFEIATPRGPVRVGVPICFEITAPWASRRIAFDGSTRAVDVLVNISNDGWFSRSAAGRRQHLQVAQLRAVELATPVVRAANTGISASINAAGELVDRLPARSAGTLAATVAVPARPAPLSATIGDGVAWAALAALAGGLVVRRRRP
jgi:apolipoprotein N-acyltransferase